MIFGVKALETKIIPSECLPNAFSETNEDSQVGLEFP